MAETIAFIGLGNMGSGMAANLAKAGYAVCAFDLSADALARAKGDGCAVAASAAEAVSGADAVVTMLPAGKHVEAVYNGDVFGAAKPGALFMDCSTIDVATARKVVEAATAKGFAMVDAPVSGGVAAASGGTLTFMVGGTGEAFARAEPILARMGKAVIHAGGAQLAQHRLDLSRAASQLLLAEHLARAEHQGEPEEPLDHLVVDLADQADPVVQAPRSLVLAGGALD
ncbi:MAG: NAD(P)-binding domain-containing protein [Sphingomonadaceae bacterium]|nr:NAD(P)-binding domain-containing protein [Sphingomonadaceae bacterium]